MLVWGKHSGGRLSTARQRRIAWERVETDRTRPEG